MRGDNSMACWRLSRHSTALLFISVLLPFISPSSLEFFKSLVVSLDCFLFLTNTKHCKCVPPTWHQYKSKVLQFLLFLGWIGLDSLDICFHQFFHHTERTLEAILSDCLAGIPCTVELRSYISLTSLIRITFWFPIIGVRILSMTQCCTTDLTFNDALSNVTE